VGLEHVDEMVDRMRSKANVCIDEHQDCIAAPLSTKPTRMGFSCPPIRQHPGSNQVCAVKFRDMCGAIAGVVVHYKYFVAGKECRPQRRKQLREIRLFIAARNHHTHRATLAC
jgi:hypothetical protein